MQFFTVLLALAASVSSAPNLVERSAASDAAADAYEAELAASEAQDWADYHDRVLDFVVQAADALSRTLASPEMQETITSERLEQGEEDMATLKGNVEDATAWYEYSQNAADEAREAADVAASAASVAANSSGQVAQEAAEDAAEAADEAERALYDANYASEILGRNHSSEASSESSLTSASGAQPLSVGVGVAVAALVGSLLI